MIIEDTKVVPQHLISTVSVPVSLQDLFMYQRILNEYRLEDGSRRRCSSIELLSNRVWSYVLYDMHWLETGPDKSLETSVDP